MIRRPPRSLTPATLLPYPPLFGARPVFSSRWAGRNQQAASAEALECQLGQTQEAEVAALEVERLREMPHEFVPRCLSLLQPPEDFRDRKSTRLNSSH